MRLCVRTLKGEVAYVTPRRFKERIGEFAPQFSGYAQHDSQVVGITPHCIDWLTFAVCMGI